MSKITIREAFAEKDIEKFWIQLHIYHKRDIFPDPENEDREYFLNDSQYRAHIELLHARETDRSRYLFFCRDGEDIGFALAVVYGSEDGKCFLLEFCVFPEHRGKGTGTECAEAFLCWARGEGAKYAELNFGTVQRQRFWSRLGFVRNGCDEWGEPLMILPPEEEVPFTVEKLTDGGDWQLHKLLNGFLAEIGEEPLSDEKKERLARAVERGEIQFFAAKRGYRSIGLCSVSRYWSTFSCGEVGVFDDFYIEPAFRKKGIARLLSTAAQQWCRGERLASLSVSCAPCDEGMYKSLGFSESLGSTLTYLI